MVFNITATGVELNLVFFWMRSKRRGDLKLQDVSVPKDKDGKYHPVMALGSQQERTKRTEYVGALDARWPGVAGDWTASKSW